MRFPDSAAAAAPASTARRLRAAHQALAGGLLFAGLGGLLAGTASAQYPVDSMRDEMPKREITLLAQARVVQQAVEQFGAERGVYPSTILDALAYLPGGELLRNVFTLAQTEPIDGAAASPGQIGYVVLVNSDGVNAGYVIDAFAKTEYILILTSDPTLWGLNGMPAGANPPTGPPAARSARPPGAGQPAARVEVRPAQ